jgi:hypothetical protein
MRGMIAICIFTRLTNQLDHYPPHTHLQLKRIVNFRDNLSNYIEWTLCPTRREKLIAGN